MKLRLSILFLTLALLLAGFGSAEERDPVRIAIVDSGISTLAIDPSCIAEGRNYARPDVSTEDTFGHGTAVASIIVGSPFAGIEGICPDAVLVPLVVESVDEYSMMYQCDSEALATVVREAVDVFDCDIINMSFSFLEQSDALAEAIAYAHEQGVLVIAASGNSGSFVRYYPGGYEHVFCIGTVTPDGTNRESFSNHYDGLDLLAPGVDLPIATMSGAPSVNTGTSFSAAYISGLASKLMTLYPSLSASQVQRILCASATDILDKGYDTKSGWGVADSEKALSYAAAGRQYRDLPDDLWLSTDLNVPSSPDLSQRAVSRAQLWVALHAMQGGTASPDADHWYTDAQNWMQTTGIASPLFPEKSLTYDETIQILSSYAAYTDRDIAFDSPALRVTRARVTTLLRLLDN